MHPNQYLPFPAESKQGQCTPEHQRLARSTSIPLCKTVECAGANGDGKEGQNEREDQGLRETAQWRQGERGVSGSEPVAVSARLISASGEPGDATSLSQLPFTGVGQKQRLGNPERALTHRETASAEPREEAEPTHSRPQQHGLLAKGVRLLRNMGNQEAKQKKSGGNGGATGDVSGDGEADERGVDKKSKKSSNKISKSGGEHSGKKKSKSESKGSMFSGMKIRKSLSKSKGLSKDDIFEDGRPEHFRKTGLQPAKEATPLDVEGDLSRLTANSPQSTLDESGRRTSSGSDADLYSFHSASADNEDLLFNIQQAIRDQHVLSDGSLGVGHLSEQRTSEVTKVPEKVTSHPIVNLDKEVMSVSHVASGECEKLENECCDMPISRNSSGPGSLSESGPPSSAPDTERSSVSLFPKTNSTYSFPDTTTTTTSYESAEETQDELESTALHPQQSKNTSVPCAHLDPVVAGAGQRGTQKSVSITDLSMEREGEEEPGRWDFLSLNRRKSSMSISQLASSSQHKRTSSNSPSTVKLYPPIYPSYVKTTTRQLTSPIGSPITSPHINRKTNSNFASLESSGSVDFRRHKQRSSSVSLSADWLSEQDTPEKSSTGGTFWTLGSRRAHYARRTSSNASPHLDVFSGE